MLTLCFCRFFRRCWVTFDRSVNIKEVCWNLQNIRVSVGVCCVSGAVAHLLYFLWAVEMCCLHWTLSNLLNLNCSLRLFVLVVRFPKLSPRPPKVKRFCFLLLTAARLWTGTGGEQRPCPQGAQCQWHHSAQAGATQWHQAGCQAHSRFGWKRRPVEQQVPGRGTEHWGTVPGVQYIHLCVHRFNRLLTLHLCVWCVISSCQPRTPFWRISPTTW